MGKQNARPDSLPDTLTQRERNILTHLAHHRSSQEIARLETLTPGSVKWYIHQIYTKLGVSGRAEAIQQARALGLLGDQPDLSSESSLRNEPAPPKNNLPRQCSSFIGREREIPQLLNLIKSYPLVTLTGSGGTGKTRLALQVAEKALEHFPDGVWFVDLASLSDPSLVPLVTVTTLGIRDIRRELALDTLRERIGRKNMLLVLDNCEHLINTTSEMTRQLLGSCRNLHLLATSREVLGLDGEHAFRCPPLTLPKEEEKLPISELAQSEALQLFAERAASVSPGFQLSEANADLVRQICVRLDGIPLAIELAAARIRLLSIQQIAVRLDNVFYLLTGGLRSSLPRHKTLKAMIDWSYNLLSEPERCLLNLLSVFVGGWTLEAAEEIFARSGQCQGEIIDLLSGLVDKSMVDVQPGQDREPRYRMLEMIRQYAYHRLAERAGMEAARERHLDYFVGLADRAEPELRSRIGHLWIGRLEGELPNLRAALEWSLEGSVVKGLCLAGRLYWFWFWSKHRMEGLDWLDRLLAAEETGRLSRPEEGQALIERQIARGRALNASANMGQLVNRDMTALVEESVAIFRSLGNMYPRDAAYAFYLKGEPRVKMLGIARSIGYTWLVAEILLSNIDPAVSAGDLDEAEQNANASLEEYTQIGDVDGIAGVLWHQGTLSFLRGRVAEAEQRYEASRKAFWASGNVEMQVFLGHFHAWMALAGGRTEKARSHSLRQLEESRAINIPWTMADALGFLAWEAFTDGDIHGAEHYCEEAFRLSGRSSKDLLSVAHYVNAQLALAHGNFALAREQIAEFFCNNSFNFPPVQLGIRLAGMLALAQAEGDPDLLRQAALLFGAQDALSPCLMNVIPPLEREAYQGSLVALRALLSEQEFAAMWAEGRAMTTSQAIQFVLGE